MHPIYTREQSVSLSAGYSSGMTGVGYQANHCCDGVGAPDTTTVYYHGDHLGSQRLITNTDGYPTWSATYLPFGQEWNPEITVNHYKFTGKERDSESNLDNFGARYDSSQYGRFMSPDPGNAGADPTNPQSWNMYSYVLNNPLNAIDPTGLNCVWDDGSYDGQDDPQTGSPGGCATQGGTWINQVTGDWNPNPNADLSAQVADIQNSIENPDMVVNGSTDMGFDTTPQATGKQNLFSCAAGVGDKYSIAGGLHALGIGTSGVGGFITDALGGNAFSGATNLISSLGSGSAGGHNVFYNMAQGVVSGPGQGILPPGIRGPWGASASGLATDAIAKTAWSSVTGAGQTLTTLGGEASLASTAVTAAEFASGVAEAKYAYDALSYATGLFVCAAR